MWCGVVYVCGGRCLMCGVCCVLCVVARCVKQFMCGVCNKYFGNQKNLRVHISEIHEGKRGQFPRDVCHKVFPRKRNMERHKNALHLKNNPVCYMCHKSVVNLEVHIKRFHKGSTEIKIKLEESAATA